MINPGEWHANRGLTREFGYRTMYVPVPLVRLLTRGIGRREHNRPDLPLCPVSANEPLRRMLLRFHAALQEGPIALEHESLMLDCLASVFFRREGAVSVESRPEEGAWVKRVREYLDQNYERNISLSELSTIAGMTPFHVVRAFQRQVGVPPHTYQTHCRVARAKRLLRARIPIPEVATTVGFFDQSHLNRHFTRIVGVTPRRFSQAQ